MMEGIAMEEIRDAITDAYAPNELTEALKFVMNVRLYNVAGPGGTYPFQVFELIDWADRLGREVELVQAVTKRRPGNTKMREVGRKYGLAVPVYVEQEGKTVPGAPTDTSGQLEEI